MMAFELPRLRNTAGVGDNADIVGYSLSKATDTLCLVRRIQAFLKPLVVRCNASRTGVLITLHRLNAAQSKHEPARRDDEISACAQSLGYLCRIDQLSTSNKFDAIL
jgi:hypothetical protein